MHLPQFLIWEMIPRTRITVQQCRSFDELLAAFASLALVRVMRVTKCVRIKLEQLAKIVLREVSGSVFGLVDHTGRKILLLTSHPSAGIRT